MQDPALLLSAGKDGRVILWDMSPEENGRLLGEFSSGGAFGKYMHNVAWSPSNPGVFATASLGAGENHDGSVSGAGVCEVRAGSLHRGLLAFLGLRMVGWW